MTDAESAVHGACPNHRHSPPLPTDRPVSPLNPAAEASAAAESGQDDGQGDDAVDETYHDEGMESFSAESGFEQSGESETSEEKW